MNSIAPNHSGDPTEPAPPATAQQSGSSPGSDRPEATAELVQDLAESLRKLADLRRRACNAEQAADGGKLAREFHEQLREVQGLQRRLVRVKLTPDQVKQIRKAVQLGAPSRPALGKRAARP